MGNKRKRLTMLSMIPAFCMVFGLSSVWAQDGDTEEFTLEEITVTAQKREENQQKVPIAMEVITGEDLASYGKDSVDEILKDIANVAINTAADGMRISIRGITDDSNVMENQHTGGSMVAVNIDGAYNSMSSAGQNLYDIERVEVLFGPQSTMYGSNSPGGIVNVVTAAPKTDKYSASATVEYGSYELLNLQAVFNAPVIQDKVALRLSANRSEQGSYLDSDEENNKTTSARLRALWDVYEDLSMSVTGTWSKRGNSGMMGGSVKAFDKEDGYWIDTDTGERLGKVTDPWTASGTDTGGGNSADQITKGGSAEINWDTIFGNISFVPSYSKSSSEGNYTRESGAAGGGGGPPPMAMSVSPMQTTTTTKYYQEDSTVQKGAEIRMTNAASFTLFQWILGGTWNKNTQSRITDYESASSSDESRDTVQNKKALYANITYPLWFYEKLKLTLGYRQSWDESNSTSVGGMMAGTSGNPEGYSKPDFKYGFEYDAADNMMLYGSYSSSYRNVDAMAMPSTTGFPPNEELKSYTLGAKSRWLDNKLQVNVSTYYYDYKNKYCTGFKEALGLTEADLGGDYVMWQQNERGEWAIAQGQDGNPLTPDTYDLDDDGDTTEPVTFDLHDQNSQGYGDFSSLGADIQISWIITSRDRVNFSVAYLNSEWQTLHFRYQWNMYWPDEDYEGITPVNSPTWSTTASYEHNFILGTLGTLTPRIDLQTKSSYYLVWNKEDEDPYGIGDQEAYYLLDASAYFNHASGRWNLNAYVKNVTDYAVKRSYMGMGGKSLMIGDPRTYGVTFSIKF